VTVGDLIRRCRRHHLALACDDRGPRLVRLRPDAECPADLMEVLKQNRGEIALWFRTGGDPPAEPVADEAVYCDRCGTTWYATGEFGRLWEREPPVGCRGPKSVRGKLRDADGLPLVDGRGKELWGDIPVCPLKNLPR
jgi:hypothetical protein